MERFTQENLDNIKSIFSAKTQVRLNEKKPRRSKWGRTLALAAAMVCFCSLSVCAVGLFSSLDGDDLLLTSVYEGDGRLIVKVENYSDKVVKFQPQIKLLNYQSGQVIEPIADGEVFAGGTVEPQSKGVLEINLAEAYDMAPLEVPTGGNWYYLVLTNNNFAFGQDWLCQVNFAFEREYQADDEQPPEKTTPQIADEIVQRAEEGLQFYFAIDSFHIPNRIKAQEMYIAKYTELFAEFDGEIVASVESPFLVRDIAPGVILDESVPAEEQYLLVGLHRRTMDDYFKSLAADGESALCISVTVPSQKYEGGSGIPLFYLMTYEKADVSADKYAFIYGQLHSFADLEPYKVYEDENYVCYEISGLMYANLDEYIESWATGRTDLRFDEQSLARIRNCYDYYKEHLSESIYYRE